MKKPVYESPLLTRYASNEMLHIFSPDYKFSTWRKLWVALAEAEQALGLPITSAQIKELKEHITDINYDVAEKREVETRHDVMSHVYAYGKQCPKAAGIIHLGATSAYVGDNTDLIQMRDAMLLVKSRLLKVINTLADFADKEKKIPTLAFTHFQPAQLTTVGKRATLWIQDLMLDLADLEHQLDELRFLGVKGTTGTQASFLELFDGNHEKVRKLDQDVTKRMGFPKAYSVAGQTYPRKVDAKLVYVLSGIAQSAHKMTNDIRLLQNLKEIEEPFGKKQIGSSAMAYKRNPMRSERIASLARLVMSFAHAVDHTAATQWFERTLDDSANKRIAVAEAFLAIDAILVILADVTDGLVVYPKMIERHIAAELPFMATENIMMEAVKRGGNRQDLHEKIREHSMAAGKNVKVEGGENDLLERIAADPSFKIDLKSLKQVMKPSIYIGRSAEQVTEFLVSEVKPILKKNRNQISRGK
ncbi:MAG: adenylosuccinate lyase, partial [Fibrobacteres bacterium]|nr:adenylosuccinate lyase [Fibrobacterota bacterium]